MIPTVTQNAWTFDPDWMQRVQRMVSWAINHPEESLFDIDDPDLTLIPPFNVIDGPVAPHTDDEAPERSVYGLVLQSDAHSLHSANHRDGLPLNRGTFYTLDPLVHHWTSTPFKRGRLLFIVTSCPVDELVDHDAAAKAVFEYADRALCQFEEVHLREQAALVGVGDRKEDYGL